MFEITHQILSDINNLHWFRRNFWRCMYNGRVKMTQQSCDSIFASLSINRRYYNRPYVYKILCLALRCGLYVNMKIAIDIIFKISESERCALLRIYRFINAGYIRICIQLLVHLSKYISPGTYFIESIILKYPNMFDKKEIEIVGSYARGINQVMYSDILKKYDVKLDALTLCDYLLSEIITYEYVMDTLLCMTTFDKLLFVNSLMQFDAEDYFIVRMCIASGIFFTSYLIARFIRMKPFLVWKTAIQNKAQLSLSNIEYISTKIKVPFEETLKKYYSTGKVVHLNFHTLNTVHDKSIHDLLLSKTPYNYDEVYTLVKDKCCDVCPICRQEMEVNTVCVTKCKHVYHIECIESWFLEQTKNGSMLCCPMCRVFHTQYI